MQKNVTQHSLRSCTGCGACGAACGVGAITLGINDEGFYAPVVDTTKCVECGACQRVCYKYADLTPLPTLNSQTCYAACSSNAETHAATTSGGFAYELSKWGIESGYRVMGVAYDYSSDMARTVIIDNIADLEQLKGSKYIQSHTEEALHAFITLATSNPSQRFICFGTPCQIYGLRRLAELKRLKNEILYVDLFCHGVPSHLVWRPYIKSMRDRLGELKSVNFRYKGNGWHQYSIRIVGERGSYCNYAYNDTFYRFFFDNVALNTSCYTCKLRQRYAPSDIRIGDFLGRAYEHREDGISAAVAITANGLKAIKGLERGQRIKVVGTHTVKECLRAQSTDDYSGVELRNKVVAKLKDGDLKATKRWYVGEFSLRHRVYLHLKSLSTLLPKRCIVMLRHTRRALR